MPKMIVNSKVIIHRVPKGGKSDAPATERVVVSPARAGKPKVVFDFTAAERDSILKQHASALSKLDETVEVEAPPPAPAPQGGNVGGTGDKDNSADQQKTGGSADGDQHADVEDADKL